MELANFNHRTGLYHASSCLRDILEFYGHNLSEALVLGLQASFGFKFSESIALSRTNPLPYVIDGCTLHFPGNTMQQFGVRMEKKSVTSDPVTLEKVKRILDRGEPVVLFADISKLKSIKSPKRCVEFGQYAVILIGYNNETAYLVTHDSPDVMSVSFDQLKAARSSKSNFFPPQNVYFEFQRMETEPDLRSLIKAAIQRTAHFFLCPQRPWLGLKGLEAFAYKLPQIPRRLFKKEEELELKTDCPLLKQQVELFHFIIKDLTNGMLRHLFANFLEEAANILDYPSIINTAKSFRESGELWNQFAEKLLQVPVDSLNRAEIEINESDSIISTILNIESRAFHALKQFGRRKRVFNFNRTDEFNQRFEQVNVPPASIPGSLKSNEIVIKGCRANNLKNINLKLSKNQLIAVTGVNGAGKSSLAFDVLARAANSQYLEMLSHEKNQPEHPEWDYANGLPPTAALALSAIQQLNPRLTTGTLSGIDPYLHRLLAKLGHPHCPVCLEKTNESLHCETCAIDIEPPAAPDFSPTAGSRICPQCKGLGRIKKIDKEKVIFNPELPLEKLLKQNKAAMIAKIMLPALSKHLEFDLESPFEKIPVELQKIILFGTKDLIAVKFGEANQTFDTQMKYPGIIPAMTAEYRQEASKSGCREIELFMTEKPCSACAGLGLTPEILAIELGGQSYGALLKMSISSLYSFFYRLKLAEDQKKFAQDYLRELRERLWYMVQAGLGYLKLNQTVPILSPCEIQRCFLSQYLADRPRALLFIFDNPTAGLHQRDRSVIAKLLQQLRDYGNTIVIIEHDELLLKTVDSIIDMGPGAGKDGGEIIAHGSYEQICRNQHSLTGDYLSARKTLPRRAPKKSSSAGRIAIWGANENNLKDIDVEFPLGKLICLTGVAGSGKASLLLNTLVPAVTQHLEKNPIRMSNFRNIDGINHIDRLMLLDQTKINCQAENKNIATYLGLWDPICHVFSALSAAFDKGLTEHHFHNSNEASACPACNGTGISKKETGFSQSIEMICDECRGKGYREEILSINFKGFNIADILRLTIDEASALFENQPTIFGKLNTSIEVGLGHLSLGQLISKLSINEAQRIKLVNALKKPDTGHTLYIFDEPSTGLHFADVGKLIKLLSGITDNDNTVILIEHNLQIIKRADWIIDLGPEAGEKGGRVVIQGTPETVANCTESCTGYFLRRGR